MNRLAGLIADFLTRKLSMFAVVAGMLLVGTLVVTEAEVEERNNDLFEQAEFASHALRANLESELNSQKQILDALSENALTSLIQLIQIAEETTPVGQGSSEGLVTPKSDPFSALSQQPSWQDFQSKLLNYLPQVQQFALLDSQGNVVLDGGGFFMGNACRVQVEHGLGGNKGGAVMLQAHFFHDGDHHYDLIYYLLEGDQVKGAILASLPLTSLSAYLSRFVTDALEVVMLNKHNPTQVILSSYEDLSLQAGAMISNEFVEQALVSMDLPNTDWRFYFFAKEGVLDELRNQLYVYAFLIFSILALLLALLQSRWANALNVQAKGDRSKAFQLYRQSPMALFVLDPSPANTIRYFSANQIEQASALKQAVIINQSFTTLLHPEEHSRWHELLSEFLENDHSSLDANFRLQKVGDSSNFRWVVNLHVVADFNENGECERLLVYLFTLSEHQTGKKLVDDLLESFPLPVFITDENGILIDANKASESFLSRNKQAFLSSPLAGCMDLESAQNYRQQLKQAEQSHHFSVLAEQDVRDTPDNLIPQEQVALRFKTANGTLTSCDVSIQLLPSLYENAFIHFLQPVVQSQTPEPEQGETPYLESYYEAALSRFNVGYHIADELEELMGFLRGVSDRLKFTFIDKVSRIHADEIRNRSDAVTRSLQDFKFLALKDEDFSKTSFDAYILVEESLHLLRLKARWHGVNFEFNYNSGCPYVWMGYENRIKQIILQLLSYVIERLACEQVRINVGCVETDKGSFLKMVFLLSSSESEKLEKANEFMVADISLTTDLANRELRSSQRHHVLKGLELSTALLRALGGEIHVGQSRNNEIGFSVDIPVDMDDLSNRYSDNKDSDVMAEQHFIDKRFLLVDSDTVVEQLLVDVLERMGAQVDVVENGIDAISFWRNYSHLYAGLLIEVNAEVMDAYEVMSFIRREEEESMLDSHFPVIAVVDRNLHNSMDLDEFDGVVETPLIVEQMVSELKRLNA